MRRCCCARTESRGTRTIQQRLPARRAQRGREIGLDPDVYGLYAFRHTSITRMLLAGTHTAIVAKCHDTLRR